MRSRTALIVLTFIVALLLVAAGCTSPDPTASDEYVSLEAELAAVTGQLATVTAERDALRAAADLSAARYNKALATQRELEAIVRDPDAYGTTRQQVVDALTAYTTPDATMDDTAFGSADMETAWYGTLYGGQGDSTFDEAYTWLCPDGSQGGALWLWRGTSAADTPFELAGISIDDFNDDGLITRTYVTYPYRSDYVLDAVVNGTPQP